MSNAIRTVNAGSSSIKFARATAIPRQPELVGQIDGIGERGAAVRERICARLDWFGLRLNSVADAASAPRISAADSQIDVCVIPTRWEWIIAGRAAELIA